MKNLIRLFFMAIAAMVSFSSCKKDDVVPKTKTELLTTGTWKLVSDQEKMGAGEWQESIGSYAACEKDDYYIFKTDLTLEYNEGATKCAPGDPQSENGVWTFAGGETKITIDGYESNLEELSSTTLTLSETFTINSVNYSFKRTYRH